jgi:cytochrome c biogenesis protein CcdA
VLALLGIVVLVGLADSINPSTVGPALYLATGPRAARNLAAFVVGVFAVSAGAGVAVVLGPGKVLLSHRPHPHTEHLIELSAGGVLVVVAAGLWLGRKRIPRRVVRNEETVRRGSALLGAAIMAVELPTALPYFAVIAAVIASGRAAATQVLLILLFNLIFVAPLLAVLGIRALAGARATQRLTILRQRLEQQAGLLVPLLVLVVAGVLVALGTVGLSRG